MNVEKLIQESKHVYSTFTKWGLKQYDCDIRFYTKEPLDDLFYVICSILYAQDEPIAIAALGEILGFCTRNVKHGSDTIAYYDKAEVELLIDILKTVEDERLIYLDEEASTVCITNLGIRSIEDDCHYVFYKGMHHFVEHLKLKAPSNTQITDFPYLEDMGIETRLVCSKQYWPEDEEIYFIIDSEETNLISRIKKQSNHDFKIFEANLDENFEIISANIEVALYQKGEQYVPVIMNSSRPAPIVTSLLQYEGNSLRKENLILECLFQKLWNDETAILDYNALAPYLELVDFEELTTDSRTVWDDELLFAEIINHANAECWQNISRHCTLNVLYKNIHQFVNELNWAILSERVESDFLIKNFADLPWDLEVISNDYNRDIKTIEQLVLFEKYTSDDWDWDILLGRFSEDFILTHLDQVDVNLSKFTKNTTECKNAVLRNIDKLWDWSIIESKFDLDFFEDHIAEVCHKLNYKVLIDRIFKDQVYAQQFAHNLEFIDILKQNYDEDGALALINVNREDYVWTPDVIRCLVYIGIASWESTKYITGLECNPHIIWTKPFFEKFHDNIKTTHGFDYVSLSIQDAQALLEYPTFNWSWASVSKNKVLINSASVLATFADKLSWEIVIANLDDITLAENIENINTLLAENVEAWTLFSEKASIDFVKKHQKWNWDWQVLTSRMFSLLKKENIGHPDFVNKWDWQFLTKQFTQRFVLANIILYVDHWDWEELFNKVLTKTNRKTFGVIKKLGQAVASISDKDKQKEAWALFSSHYTFEEIKSMATTFKREDGYHWDMTRYYADGETSIMDLTDYSEYVDWSILSEAPKIISQLIFDKRKGITYPAWKENIKAVLSSKTMKWDIYKLSHTFYDQKWFVYKFKDLLDWKFVSERSTFFTKSKDDLNAFLEAFHEKIDFEVLSQRSDIDARFLIRLYPQKEYNFNKLAEDKKIKVDLKFIEERSEYSWDWQMVSRLDTFIPTEDFLIKNIDKPFDWKAISRKEQTTIWTSAKFIKYVAKNHEISSQIDWFLVSQDDDFPIDPDTLMIVPLQELDWTTISHRPTILKYLDYVTNLVDWSIICESNELDPNDLDFLKTYKSFINWAVLCQRKDFKFTKEILSRFTDYIDWQKASSSYDLKFTTELVEEYKDHWNWHALKQNKAFTSHVQLASVSSQEQRNIVKFIGKFPRKPQAFHFTHMSNAVRVIRTQKILSRNRAAGLFTNSAGENVHRVHKAHMFARFYFWPQSPTQFYNEFLGKDKGDRYYAKAIKNGLPKCPLPVFFVVDIEELTMTMPEKCFYSNGNMQKDCTAAFQISKDPDHILAPQIYTRDKDARQQEFLVLDELNLSGLQSLKIVCYNKTQAQILREEVRDSVLVHRIVVDPTLYCKQNKEIVIENTRDAIQISTQNYLQDFTFRIKYQGQFEPDVQNTEDVIRQTSGEIVMQEKVDIKKETSFQVFFDLKYPRQESWLIYTNQYE